jgi:uncharacterized protein (DUF58 family)
MKLVSIKPSKRLLKMITIVLISAIVLPFFTFSTQTPFWTYSPFALLAGAVILALFDALLSLKAPAIAINRDLPNILSLYQETAVRFLLVNEQNQKNSQPIYLNWIEKIPNEWECKPYDTFTTLLPGETQEHEYFVKPHMRGQANIEGAYLRLASSWRFWQLTWFKEHNTEHKVYPNFSAIADSTGLNGSVNLQQMGLKKFNLRGAGMDFLQLRDYREGESLRQIDWRATSRFNKLISKEFQEEKNQHILIMLDAGRRMRVQDDELSYFEHALNALIMLSFTALKNGDNLSIQSFGSESRWLNQVRGAQNVSRVLHHFYDLYPEKISSDYLSAAQELMQKHPKRSLVLLVSCLRDEDFEDLLLSVQLLQEKHLVAVISIEEPIYKEIEQNDIRQFDDALNYASSTLLQRNIEMNIKRLKHRGVICIKSQAPGLTASLINSYLSIKKAGLL